MAGTAQAKPLIIGITLFPFNPTLRISLSLKKLIRAMYPVSSNKVMRPNNIIICGTKITIPPMPATKPFTSKSSHHTLGSIVFK